MFWDEALFKDLETELHQNGQNRGGDRAFQNKVGIIKGESRYDWLAQTAGADESRQSRRADANHRSRAHPGQNGRHR